MQSANASVSVAVSRALHRHVPTPGPLPTPCWIWQGCRSSAGYPTVAVKIDGVRYTKTVHRLLYRVLRREPARGRHLHHLCENPVCVNPWHLRELTPAQHLTHGDSAGARNKRKSRCDRGHPFTPENTRIEPNRSGWFRRCRACRQEDRARANVISE